MPNRVPHDTKRLHPSPTFANYRLFYFSATAHPATVFADVTQETVQAGSRSTRQKTHLQYTGDLTCHPMILTSTVSAPRAHMFTHKAPAA
mmetsp:Transcript_260/g.666  ORF Transcript_260/g.666 Transcript_260/m.666 type:complete len:90 (+) Transcript_260:1142-1411(+)